MPEGVVVDVKVQFLADGKCILDLPARNLSDLRGRYLAVIF